MKEYTIAVAGIGYVGISLALVLSQHNKVIAFDINQEKVNSLNSKKWISSNNAINEFLKKDDLNLTATTDCHEAFADADFVIISTPTNYNPDLNSFDTNSVEQVINSVIQINPYAVIVIKSTVPIGFTQKIREKLNCKIIFSPEFLREDKSLADSLNPSRIVIGTDTTDNSLRGDSKIFASLLKEASENKNTEIVYMSYTEAEAVKLFSNTYLAMRISFFNELDTYAEQLNLNTQNIITGMCLDKRIGNYYNNPSFGYGGYCLPKDTKQLLTNYADIPQNLITSIVESNKIRKNYIADKIIEIIKKDVNLSLEKVTVGIYRINMKTNSDNYRESSILDIIEILKRNKINILIYEPTLKDSRISDCKVEKDLDIFKKKSDLIVANRYNDCLDDVKNKVYTRDLFGIN